MNVRSSTLDHYVDVIKKNSLLSRKEEHDLFGILHKYKGGKQKDITRDKLFNSNVALVMKYAYHYSRHSSISVLDLIGAGNIGLGMAIDRFNHKKRTKFSTYAVPWIKLYIFRTLKVMGRIVSIPPHIIEKSRKYRQIIEDESRNKVSEKDIKKTMNITEKVLRYIKAAQIKSISVDQPLRDGEEGQDTLYNVLPDPKTLSISGKCLMDEERREAILGVLKELNNIQREVICARYMGNAKMNLNDIGKRLNVTGERVRQIEVRALRRMRLKLRQRGYLKLE